MLIGQYKSKLTDKDRVAIPKKFREELGNELIIARWYEQSLVLVSVSGWKALRNRLIGDKGLVVLPVRDIDRFILGSAFEIKVDAQGRFVLNEALKTYAQVKDEVTFVGLEDRVEVWSTQNWEELERVAREKATKAIEELAKK